MNDFFQHAFEFVFLAFLLNLLINFLFGIDIASTAIQFVQELIAKWTSSKDKDSD